MNAAFAQIVLIVSDLAEAESFSRVCSLGAD